MECGAQRKEILLFHVGLKSEEGLPTIFSVIKSTWAAGTPDNIMGLHEYCGEIRNIGLDGELSDWGLGGAPISI